jgi:molecular chaperone GrpE
MDGNNKKQADEIPDDVVLEEEEAETMNGKRKDKIKQLRDKLSACEEERKEYLAGWQRAKADMVNLRRKNEDEKRNLILSAERGLIEDLLPALESFDMAFKDKTAWEAVPLNWRNGVEYIHNQIWETLASRGLEKIEPAVGDKFDPNLHESLQNVPVADKNKDNQIDSVVRAGYRIKDRVIRPAKVKVSHFEMN